MSILKSERGTATTIADALHKLLVWLDRNGLASYDYADILRSPVIRRLTLGNQFLQQLAIQFGKRFPFNVRTLIGVTPHVSSQTLALLCSARAWQYCAQWPDVTTEDVREGADALLADRLEDGIGRLWGMKLYFASRFVQATPTTPNLFQTSNAIHALLDAFQVTADDRYAYAADGAVVACVERLGLVPAARAGSGATFCRYYPGMDTAVYNVNALLAAASWRLSMLDVGDAHAHAQRAESLLTFVLAGQRPDGAWPYAAHASGQWVDGYHSGYVLEGLGHLRHSSAEARVQQALENGAAYFRTHLLDPDGCPKYYDKSLYPIDVQNCAQAIQTIARLQPQGGFDLPLLIRAVDCAVRNLFLVESNDSGYFAATQGRWLMNRTPYVRWGQAPMALALTFAWNAEHGGSGYMPLGKVAPPSHADL